jgi:DNA primase small subunit
MLSRAYEILEPYFIQDVIVSSEDGGHGVLDNEEQWLQVLDRLPDCASLIRDNLKEQWSTTGSTPIQKWNQLKRHVSIFLKNGTKALHDERSNKKAKTLSETEKSQLELFCVEIVLRYTYPRIDINVSKMRNHLLKSPFCVHPKTGRICVPIPQDQLYNFNPFTVPTLSQIVQELDTAYRHHHHANQNVEKIHQEVNDDKDNTIMICNSNEEDTSEPTTTTVDETCTTTDDNDDTIPNPPGGRPSVVHRGGAGGGGSANTKYDHERDWETTSLAPYYHSFVQEFLIPLQQDVHRTQRDEQEQLAAQMGDF